MQRHHGQSCPTKTKITKRDSNVCHSACTYSYVHHFDLEDLMPLMIGDFCYCTINETTRNFFSTYDGTTQYSHNKGMLLYVPMVLHFLCAFAQELPPLFCLQQSLRCTHAEISIANRSFARKSWARCSVVGQKDRLCCRSHLARLPYD